MNKTGKERIQLEGPAGILPSFAEDPVARKLALLIEGQCLGLGPTQAALKYGYSKHRYFQVLHAYFERGSEALMPQKTGPKTPYVRPDNVVTQAIRHRFLDPDASAAVITQKLQQPGIRVSQRSVERILAEHGLQKKTVPVAPQGARTRG